MTLLKPHNKFGPRAGPGVERICRNMSLEERHLMIEHIVY